MRGSDTDELYRLYRPEWTIHTREAFEPDAQAMDIVRARLQQVAARLLGRYPVADIRLDAEDHGGYGLLTLSVRRPNLKGEFKYAHLAKQHAEQQGWTDYTIVARHSPDDHDLRAYGTKRLPA